MYRIRYLFFFLIRDPIQVASNFVCLFVFLITADWVEGKAAPPFLIGRDTHQSPTISPARQRWQRQILEKATIADANIKKTTMANAIIKNATTADANMSHSQMLGKFKYGGGPIFKVVLEC